LGASVDAFISETDTN